MTLFDIVVKSLRMLIDYPVLEEDIICVLTDRHDCSCSSCALLRRLLTVNSSHFPLSTSTFTFHVLEGKKHKIHRKIPISYGVFKSYV